MILNHKIYFIVGPQCSVNTYLNPTIPYNTTCCSSEWAAHTTTTRKEIGYKKYLDVETYIQSASPWLLSFLLLFRANLHRSDQPANYIHSSINSSNIPPEGIQDFSEGKIKNEIDSENEYTLL